MARLTMRDKTGFAKAVRLIPLYAIVDRLAAYEDMGMEPEQVSALQTHPDHAYADYVRTLWHDIGGMEHMEAVAKAEREDRLLVLPCKVGDTVWRHDYDEYGIALIDKGTVYAVSINEKTNWFSARYISGLRYDYTWDDLGKTVFRTREEAEAALKQEVADEN